MKESEFYSSYRTRSLEENFYVLKFEVYDVVNLYTSAAERNDVVYLKLIHQFVQSESFFDKRWSCTIWETYNPGNADEDLNAEIESPMMAAIKARSLRCVKFLCEIGRSADLFVESVPGRNSPFILACVYNYSEILSFILSSSDILCSHEALRRPIYDGLKNRTLLFRCSSIGDLENIQLLLERRNLPVTDSFDDSNDLKMTAFMISCFGGHAEVVEYFIGKFRDENLDFIMILNMRNHKGQSAAHLAAIGYIEDLALLGDDPCEDAKNRLLNEAVGRHLKVLNLLHLAGCDFRAVDKDKNTPLLLVCKLQDLCSLDILSFFTSTYARDELLSIETSSNPFFWSLYHNCEISCLQHLSNYVPKEFIILKSVDLGKLLYSENLEVISWFVPLFLSQSAAEDTFFTEFLTKFFRQAVLRNDEKKLNLTMSFYNKFGVSPHITFERLFKNYFLSDLFVTTRISLPITIRLVELGLCVSSERDKTLELYRKIYLLHHPELIFNLLQSKLHQPEMERDSAVNIKDIFDFYNAEYIPAMKACKRKRKKLDALILLKSVIDGLERIQQGYRLK